MDGHDVPVHDAAAGAASPRRLDGMVRCAILIGPLPAAHSVS